MTDGSMEIRWKESKEMDRSGIKKEKEMGDEG